MGIRTDIDIQIDGDDLRTLIEQYKYGRYCEDVTLPLERSRLVVLDLVQQHQSRDDSKCVADFSPSGQLLGVLLFRLSQWDTDHFGYNVAIIDWVITAESDYDQKREIVDALLEQFHAWCPTAGIRFVSVKVPAMDLPAVHSFERWGFRYIESWIYNNYNLDKADEFEKPSWELRLAKPDDCSVLLDYSKGAFVTQRFHADPYIARDKADSLYEKWILTAFQDPRQDILVLDIENKPVASMIYYRNDLRQHLGLQFAMWKMALLDPASRGKGVGTNFFVSLLHHHGEEGLDVVDSGLSMRNLASLNLHIKLNFKVTSMLVTFHKWMG